MSIDRLVIDVSGLSHHYGDRVALSGLTMQVKGGDVVGLVGANGGGKTTALRMLAGLLAPSSGKGTVLGRDVMQPRQDARMHMGYMPQALALYPDLTVAENLRFRADILRFGKETVHRVAKQYGLLDILAVRVAALSGGWARRVQFVASVMHRPDLLLLDEPTAGLDVRTRQDLWRWIGAAASRRCAVIVSTHDLHEAEQCPLIMHFRNGQVEGPISPAQLKERTGAPTLEAAVLAEAGR